MLLVGDGYHVVAHPQDTVTHKDSLPPPSLPHRCRHPYCQPAPSIEQIRYMEGLKTATRGASHNCVTG